MLQSIGRLLKDRFLIFVVIGLLFFLWEDRQDGGAELIEVRPGDIAMLEGRWVLQTGAPPSETEMQALIERHLREEVLVREALRLGLDRGDTIIRRRLAQKLELLMRDQHSQQQVDREAVESYFAAHPSKFVVPRHVGFRHIYLGTDEETASASDHLVAIRRDLASRSEPEAWRRLGSAFILAREFAPRSEAALAGLFGAEFAARLVAEPAPGEWLGPVRSSYGWHLVQVLVVEPERRLNFAEAAEQATRDLTAERTARAMDAEFDRMSQRYTIRHDWRPE